MELFVPGRLCLFGEHSDWAAGYRSQDATIPTGRCLVAGTDQGLRAGAERAEGVVEIETRIEGRPMGPWRVRAEVATLRRASSGGGFFSYAASTAAEVIERHRVGGLRLGIESDLQIGRAHV